MISAIESNVTAEQINSTGRDFASKYYDAFAGKPDAFRRFFDATSKYSFVQRCGRPDHNIQGADAIAELVDRMQYGRCTVTVRSVDTTRVGPTRFKVSVVGELLRPENDVPRKFLQSTVIKRAPWTRLEFLVVETVFEFDDKIVDDVLPKAGGKKINIFDPLQAQVVARRTNANGVGKKSSPSPTAAVGDGLRNESSSPRTGNSKRHYVRTMDVFNSNAMKKPAPKGPSTAEKSAQPKDESNTAENPKTDPRETGDAQKMQTTKSDVDVDKTATPNGSVPKELVITQTDNELRTPAVSGSRTHCVRKTKNAAKNPMADCVPSYIGAVRVSSVKQKADTKKPTATDNSVRSPSPRIDVVRNALASTARILNEKSLAKTPPAVANVSPKIDSIKTPSTGENAAFVVSKRPKGNRSERPAEPCTSNGNNTKTLVSKNRFGCLTVDDDDFGSRSSENPISLFKNTPKDFTGRKRRPRHNKLRGSHPTLVGPKNVTTMRVPTTDEMSMTPVESPAEDSCETSETCRKDLEPCDEPSASQKTLAAVPDEPIVTPDSAVAVVVNVKAAEVVDEEVTMVIDEEVAMVIDELVATVIDEAETMVIDEAVTMVIDEEVALIMDDLVAMVIDEEVAMVVDEEIMVIDEKAADAIDEEVAMIIGQKAAEVIDEEVDMVDKEVAMVIDEVVVMVIDEAVAMGIDEKVNMVIDEEAVEPSESEKCSASMTNHSYIRQVGKIYGRAFVKEVIYPLLLSINPLEWW